MTQQFFSFVNSHNAMASGSSFNSKRKARNDESDDEQEATPMRVRSPPLKRRVTTEFQKIHYSTNNVPDLMTDHSNSASDEDTMMDQDTDGDQAMDGMGDMEARDLDAQGGGYASQYAHVFGNDGSGGMGFGPGAEEDMMSESSESSKTQAFSTSLQAPRGGVFQPTVSAPLAATATEVEKARSTHGPHCRSIPRLVISPYADPDTGKQSMYSMCPDCGACEKAA